MIPTHLLENALALCGKNHEEFFEEFYCGIFYDRPDIRKSFSIEKFAYFLLSKEFLTKQNTVIYGALHKYALAIHDYQLFQSSQGKEGNESDLINLLTKIPGKTL